jgi:hypothetical protein
MQITYRLGVVGFGFVTLSAISLSHSGKTKNCDKGGQIYLKLHQKMSN